MPNNLSNKVKTESIDEVIIRLLKLNPGTEIDYQTYFEILKKKLAISRLAGKELPREEDELLREELKRVRRVKDKGIRFKVKKAKTKITSAASVPTDAKSATDNKITSSKSSAIVKYKKSMISPRDIVPVKVDDVTEKKEKKKDGFTGIKKTLESILNILGSKFKFDQKQSDQERRDKETERRIGGESALEGFKKGISSVVSLTKKMLSPFQNIIDRIKRFIFFVLLGRAFNAFMDWMSDKENQEKFNAFIEFLTDHWPAIAGLYILFGTSFGKLVRGLLKGIARTIIALGMSIPRIFGFLKKNKKFTFLALAASPFIAREVKKQVEGVFVNKDKETPESGLIPSINPELDEVKKGTEQAKNTKIPQLNTGGMIPTIPEIPTFNFGGMIPTIPEIPTFNFGGMDLQSGVPITGAGKDDTLIAAKTGEAILTEKDQIDLSQRYVDRTTGEPLNVPQYLSGRKPGFVNMSNLKMGGGFFDGGIIGSGNISIPKFNLGGVIGNREVNIPNLNFDSTSSNLNLGLKDMSFNNEVLTSNSNNYKKYQKGGLINNAMNFFNQIFNLKQRNKQKPQLRPNIKIPSLPEYQTPEVKALLKTIRTAEHYKGSDPYHSIYGGASAPITQMTIQEVIEMGNSGKLPKRFGGKSAGYGSGSAATGAYQFMPFTLQDLIRRGSAKPGETMTSTVQDRLGWELVKNRGVDLKSLRRTGLNQVIMDMMAPEWASFPYSVAGGKSYYGQPVKGADFLRKIYLESLNSINKPKKQKGGLIRLIKENTGANIPGGPDRQLTALQPGEYVLPVDTVNRLGVSFIEKMVAMTDSNSDAYLKKGKIGMPKITPYNTMSSNMSGAFTLPPITQSMGDTRMPGYGGGSSVPDFSVTAPNNNRDLNARIYGLSLIGSLV